MKQKHDYRVITQSTVLSNGSVVYCQLRTDNNSVYVEIGRGAVSGMTSFTVTLHDLSELATFFANFCSESATMLGLCYGTVDENAKNS